ncbi:hypothetical protein GTA08_BOTSDO06578 [Botryosphaeria dothidea]|uniref:Uncharacterized protein n=1 Tax=Botryosphaeria dothidea TaxID=55169 RepID=A0A8H4MZQ4_9PEZI|nr:hypothetical protein GTA08_BOTSDO06578 [Botryosphaeria dothidea]
MVWLRLLEVWATTRLLSSPAFHRAVHNVYRRFHRLRHGTPMEEMGGTNIDRNRAYIAAAATAAEAPADLFAIQRALRFSCTLSTK